MKRKSPGEGISRIGTFQGVIISYALTVGTLFMVVSREVATSGGFDSYIAAPIGYLLALVMVIPAFMIYGRFPGERVGQLSQRLLGPFLGKGLALLIATATFLMGAVLMRNGARFIATAVMQETPIWFFMLMGLFLVIYALSGGFEVLVRAAQILSYLVFGSLIFLFVSALPYMDMVNLLPIFSRGVSPLFHAILPIFGFAGEFVLFAGFLAPHLSDSSKAIKVGILGWLGAGLAISATTLAVQGIFGPHQVVKFTNPPLELAKVIQIGGISQGVEALLVAAWMVAAFMEISVYYYISTVTLKDCFGEPFKNAWILLLSVPFFIAGYLIRGQAEIFLYRRLLRYYALLPLGVGSYVLLGLVAAIRGQLKRPSREDRKGGRDHA